MPRSQVGPLAPHLLLVGWVLRLLAVSVFRAGHRPCPEAGQGQSWALWLSRAVDEALGLPRITVQAPWLCRARGSSYIRLLG